MFDILPFLFAQIAKIFENFVRPDEYILQQCIFVSDSLHMHQLHSPHESCKILSDSNSKWQTSRHFCLLKLTKYLKIWCVYMNISNTNEYLFLIIYTCINYNPPMYPYNYQQSTSMFMFEAACTLAPFIIPYICLQF